MNSILEKQTISLTGGIPREIQVEGGLDLYNSKFHLNYPESSYGKTLKVSLEDANGQKVSMNLELVKGGYLTFQFDDHGHQEIGQNFGFLILSSPIDITIDIRSEVTEGGFIEN